MADELSLGYSFDFDKDDMEWDRAQSALLATIAGDEVQHGKIVVPTTEIAIPLGLIDSLGWALFRNLDETNYVEIRSATGADNDIIRIPPSKFALFHFGSDVSAPYIIANTASCKVEYFISEQ